MGGTRASREGFGYRAATQTPHTGQVQEETLGMGEKPAHGIQGLPLPQGEPVLQMSPAHPPHPSIQPSIIHPSFHPSIYPFVPPRIHASSRSSLHQLLVHPFLLLFIHPTQTRTEHRRCRSILLGRSASAENRNRPTGLMGVGACVRPFLWEHSTEEATCLRDREGRRGRWHLSYLSKEGQELFRQIRRGKGVQGEDWRCGRAGLS